MPTPITEDAQTPKALIGCSNCLSNGNEVAEWFDALDAADVTLHDVHRFTPLQEGCGDLDAFSIVDLPIYQETNLHTVTKWAKLMKALDPSIHDAFYEWIEMGLAEYDEDGVADLESFHKSFLGIYNSVPDNMQEELAVQLLPTESFAIFKKPEHLEM